MIYAVIDTNVLVSALFTSNKDAAAVKVVEAILCGAITPLLNEEIFEEYTDVLNRPKFHFPQRLVKNFLDSINGMGIITRRAESDENFVDPKDVVFYEVALSKENAYLVTGNIKHFPKSPIVVTPAEMIKILEESAGTGGQ
ncbi:MAG: putative toxin-antitoxin system toxin component, PIN family [Prevotella sp.]|nr:putative toxin-antitoxin system toxin component, PIN family [Prevotella sp.]